VTTLPASLPQPAELAALLPAAATRLFLIRHAEVEVTYHRVFGGRIDMNLSPLGQKQAGILAEWLRNKPLDAIYSSPMKRVQQTLAPLLLGGAPKPVILDDLREVDFGDWTGHAWEAVREKFGASATEWLHQIERGMIRNGETGTTFRARVEPCLRQIIQNHSGQTVAIACHGGVICMMLSLLMQLPLSKISLFDIEYASVSQILMHPHRVEFELFNFTPWRDLQQ
jgi:broad specificity phosphatase PhoE